MKSPRSLIRGDLFSPVSRVKNKMGENWCQRQLADPCLHRLLEHVDGELAEEVRQKGCRRCPAGKLHRAAYRRKPRGGPSWDTRQSFCCDQDDCRRRHTPPSVRFLGRKVYAGIVVVLVSAMRHGPKPRRLQRLREALGIDRRTLERWRQWWLETFARSRFWKEARARLLPLLSETLLPWSLYERFGIEDRERLVELLRFLSPITTVSPHRSLPM